MGPWGEWQQEPQEMRRERQESRQSFLEARLASTPGVWLRDKHRAAQARGLRATGLSLSALILFLMGLGAWLGSWPVRETDGAWIGACYALLAAGMFAWHLHRERRPGWRRRRHRGQS